MSGSNIKRLIKKLSNRIILSIKLGDPLQLYYRLYLLSWILVYLSTTKLTEIYAVEVLVLRKLSISMYRTVSAA